MINFISPDVFNALDRIMTYYPNDISEESKIEIETLLDHCLNGLAEDSEKFLSALFIKALRIHLEPSNIEEHIYLKKFEIPQIKLFNILIEQFPFVKISQEIVNASLIRQIRESKSAVLIDIGIGQGLQMCNILDKLLDDNDIERLTIIGIEPFKDALNIATESIVKYTKKLPFEFSFYPIQGFIEKIDFTEIQTIISQFNGKVVINESLALHHIQSMDERQKTIAKLRLLNPKAFYMIEPNTDHFEPDFYRRFQNCHRHFNHVFQVIDKLEISREEKNGLKLFFGREIEDIIGKEESLRFEKHEPAYRWIEKLRIGGFRTANVFEGIPEYAPYDLEIEYQDPGYLGFRYKTETVLSVICATI